MQVQKLLNHIYRIVHTDGTRPHTLGYILPRGIYCWVNGLM